MPRESVALDTYALIMSENVPFFFFETAARRIDCPQNWMCRPIWLRMKPRYGQKRRAPVLTLAPVLRQCTCYSVVTWLIRPISVAHVIRFHVLVRRSKGSAEDSCIEGCCSGLRRCCETVYDPIVVSFVLDPKTFALFRRD